VVWEEFVLSYSIWNCIANTDSMHFPSRLLLETVNVCVQFGKFPSSIGKDRGGVRVQQAQCCTVYAPAKCYVCVHPVTRSLPYQPTGSLPEHTAQFVGDKINAGTPWIMTSDSV